MSNARFDSPLLPHLTVPPPQAFSFTDFMLTGFTPSPSRRRARAARWDDQTRATAATHPSWTSGLFLITLVPQRGRKLPHRVPDHRWGGGALNVTSYLQEAAQLLSYKNTIPRAFLSPRRGFSYLLPPTTRTRLKTSPSFA